MTLLQKLATPQRLGAAWQEILASASADEAPSAAVRGFAGKAMQAVTDLAAALSDGTYTPQALYHVDIAKPDGGRRPLDIPPVADRIVEKALIDLIEPYVDPHVSCAAVGFRPGLGVVDAVQRIVQQRDAGLKWVLRTDLNDCFPTIPRYRAAYDLMALLPDHSLDELIGLLLARTTQDKGRIRPVEGLPQGSALSPLLANLVLSQVDDALMDAGFPVVRYADDMTVMCRSADDAGAALELITQVVKELGMSIETAKTEIMDFDTGFSFLGEDFGPFYPPLLERHRTPEPLKRTLYVARSGGRVCIRNGQIVVTTKDDVDVLSVPSSHVGGLVLFGPVGLAAGARSWMLQQGIRVVFASRTGGYLGLAVPGASGVRLSRLRAQLRTADDPERALAFGRAVVSAKVRHQITLVQRFNTRQAAGSVQDDLGVMRDMIRLIAEAKDRATLMGLEGAAARAYFAAVSKLVPAPMRFQGRSRRPPMDVFNAAISYGYAVLLGECVSALVSCGLEPGIGMLHADDDARPSLALDLMEEFRPYVVDQVVLRLCRQGGLTTANGQPAPQSSGVYLDKPGKAAVVDGYERRMLQVTRGASPGFAGSIRRHVYRQAQLLAGFIMGQNDEWLGLSWR